MVTSHVLSHSQAEGTPMQASLSLVKNEHEKDNELSLIAASKAGDRQAFHKLYQIHISRVYALSMRLCANATDAEEVAQEVFIQVWQKLDSFRGESKFSTWLHSVASHIALSHIRKRKTWWQRFFSESNEELEQTPVEHVNENEHGLDKYIARLPEQARIVFVLFAVEGYRHEEISKMLDIAVGSSKSQYHRARMLLREWIPNE